MPGLGSRGPDKMYMHHKDQGNLVVGYTGSSLNEGPFWRPFKKGAVLSWRPKQGTLISRTTHMYISHIGILTALLSKSPEKYYWVLHVICTSLTSCRSRMERFKDPSL